MTEKENNLKLIVIGTVIGFTITILAVFLLFFNGTLASDKMVMKKAEKLGYRTEAGFLAERGYSEEEINAIQSAMAGKEVVTEAGTTNKASAGPTVKPTLLYKITHIGSRKDAVVVFGMMFLALCVLGFRLFAWDQVSAGMKKRNSARRDRMSDKTNRELVNAAASFEFASIDNRD